MINEATLEARIDNLLQTIFPTFNKLEIVHQTSFTLKFGHHVISIDGKSPQRNVARAISDVLIKSGDKNLILLELKKEGHTITSDDIEQGLSYGRLMHPMPPITLITNGSDHHFFNTYTKEKMTNPPMDLGGIEKLLNSAFHLAISDKKSAINTLMSNDTDVIATIINNISKERFDALKGHVSDLSKPIAENYQIKREILNIIDEKLKTHKVIGLVGSAFSGKTNILYQFYNQRANTGCSIFYINCKDFNYSIFQQLSNHFSRFFGFSIDKDKVREWILSSSLKDDMYSMCVIFDNLDNNIDVSLKNEITEFIDLFKDSNNIILFSTDKIGFKDIGVIENRAYETIIGKASKTIEIDDFSDNEYVDACKILFNECKALIQHGGHKTVEYREPRTLRYLAAIHYQGKDNIIEGQAQIIQAIPDFRFFSTIVNSIIFTSEINDLYKKYAVAFQKDEPNRKSSSHLNIAASGSGAVSLNTIKAVFGNDYEHLIKSGTVVIKDFYKIGQVVFPKIQELLSFHSIDLIYENILSYESVEDAYKYFVNSCVSMPYCDIVGVKILIKLATSENVRLCMNLVGSLLNDPPKKEIITKGTKIISYYEDIGHLQINFEDDMDEGGFITNFLPHIILSQFASYPFLLCENDNEPSVVPYLKLVTEIGSTPITLLRTYALPFKKLQSVSIYEFKKYGEIICGNEGIVEPIVQSLNTVFHHNPNLVEALYKKAIKQNNFQLIWRIYIAIRNETQNTDEKIALKASEFMQKFDEIFPLYFSEIITDGMEDEELKKEMRAFIISKETKI